MAKIKVEFEFDYHEECEELEQLARYRDLYSDAYDAYYVARDRLKHGEGVTEEEARVLDRIKELLGGYV